MEKMLKKYMGIEIDLKQDSILSPQGKKLLKEYYCKEGETSPQHAFARASVAYCAGDMELAQRIYKYVSLGWFMFSSPVLSNAPLEGEKVKALPISCFLSYVPDSLEGLIEHTSELRWLSVKGGGVGGHWSDVRSISDIAPGPIPFLHTVNADMTAYRQGKTRKGSYAAYMDISHPDILEFIGMRTPTGDLNRKCLNIHHAINLTDDFMKAVECNQDWHLKDPNDGTVRETMKARKLWEYIIETRFRTGEPYMNFIDTANAALPYEQKRMGFKNHGSNLCGEIHLITNEKRTAVCCLSSLNLERWDEFTYSGHIYNVVRDCIRFLDNVLQWFIDHAPDTIEKARYSAQRERSLGLGAMGFHSYLQKLGVAFESDEAVEINKEIFSKIKHLAVLETKQLAKERGPAPDMDDVRNAHLLAIAPNANSSAIGNTSPSIEPWNANAFVHRTRAGSHLIKNKYLEAVLEKHGKNTEDVWTDIITSGGSVQHLEFLTDEEKKVFKTAMEIKQVWIVFHAADRQKFICQGQSVNLFFAKGAEKRYVHEAHFLAWKLGLKGLYYLRTESSAKAEKISKKVKRERLEEYNDTTNVTDDDCLGCQG